MKFLQHDKLTGAFALSTLFHLLGIGVIIWINFPRTIPSNEVPVAVELWASHVSSLPTVAMDTAESKEVMQAKSAMDESVEPPKADVYLNRRAAKPPRVASAPLTIKPKWVPKQDAVENKSMPKPMPKHEKMEGKPLALGRTSADSLPARAHKNKVSKPQPDKSATYPSQDMDDLLGDLGKQMPSRTTTTAGRSPVGDARSGTQPRGGDGVGEGYAAKVQAKIRPFIQLPSELQGNPKAVVLVTLLPSLEVRDVKLLSSSGNSAYDAAVQRAIWEAGTFPSLPTGGRFIDYRQLKLEFRPSQ